MRRVLLVLLRRGSTRCQKKTAIKGARHHPTVHKQTTAMMTTTTTTTTNTTNTNTHDNAPRLVGAAVECADLCAPYITLEEARREREEAERQEERRAEWGDRLESAQRRAFKRARAAMEEVEAKETDDHAAKAAAMMMRERLASPLEMWFSPALERDVTRQKRLVEECLDDVRARAVLLLPE
jgi:hypothetical protein